MPSHREAAQPSEAALAMVRELHAFERDLRAAYASCARLSSALVDAQIDAGLSSTVGHQVFTAASNASVHVSTAIGHSAEAHRFIETLGKKLGYDVTQYGDGQKYPSPGAADIHDQPVGVAA